MAQVVEYLLSKEAVLISTSVSPGEKKGKKKKDGEREPGTEKVSREKIRMICS
jgi:hypothetical protein